MQRLRDHASFGAKALGSAVAAKSAAVNVAKECR